MKGLSRLLLFFYLLIMVLWVVNSHYLFSIWGVTVWLLIILLGFVIYKKLNNFFIFLRNS
ncbi:Flp pilus assembly protein TadB [Bacillus pakistanensis]|uniref:Flp pilus assembly protein TadB n=1 Tax=Rossellomorea pakistanensis TaxID=992288 RepID=A0ABS2NDU6_9BACI|nr:Flp pilus assembly protein TadB [Bacillus pakistanensis]